MSRQAYDVDVVVVGGGPGGLATAALLARRGLSVRVLERAATLGGRAATHEKGGYFFNEGAHALYVGGAAARVLEGLGVRPEGRRPPAGGLMVRDGRVYGMPSTLGALLTTGLVGPSAKLQGAKVFARLGSFDCSALASITWSEWIGGQVADASMRAALEAFVRVATYANAPDLVSAGATIAQLRLALRPGVAYLHGGWQQIVRGLAAAAQQGGASIATGCWVSSARCDGDTWRVSLHDGETVHARTLVLATSPATAANLVASQSLSEWAARAIPARAACLDVALSRLPDPRATFALGIDAPTYLSVHSRTARVAPPGAALVSTMKYLPARGSSDPARDRMELEGLLDLLQPGWREVIVCQRYLPAMVATNAIVTAGGERPASRVPDASALFVVGDWVGDEGMLLDASLASAERAAAEIAAMAKAA